MHFHKILLNCYYNRIVGANRILFHFIPSQYSAFDIFLLLYVPYDLVKMGFGSFNVERWHDIWIWQRDKCRKMIGIAIAYLHKSIGKMVKSKEGTYWNNFIYSEKKRMWKLMPFQDFCLSIIAIEMNYHLQVCSISKLASILS